MRRYGFINLGRDKNPNRSTQHTDRVALVALRDALGGVDARNAAAFGCEFNEGDDNDEMALGDAVFKGWRRFGENTREPIWVTPDLARGAKASVQWVNNTAVRRWSPRRSVMRVDLADGETLVTGHPAAGPYTPQPRPDWAQEPLRKSWHALMDTWHETKRQARADGRNVTSMSDLNRWDVHPAPGELEVVHEHTDYGFAWAAEGYRADFRAGSPIHVGLDSHKIQLMRGRYVGE